jgi:uncharacterized protein involved in oxidation of intracellular sulfur
MKALVVVTDASALAERCVTGLRLAQALLRTEGTDVQVFLVGSAVECAAAGRGSRSGTVDPAHLLASLIGAGGDVRACSTSLADRGIDASELLLGILPAATADLASMTLAADRLLVF